MRQDIVDVFHHHVDVKVQHPVDRVRVGIDQVAADINTGIGVQDIELACLLIENAGRSLFGGGNWKVCGAWFCEIPGEADRNKTGDVRRGFSSERFRCRLARNG